MLNQEWAKELSERRLTGRTSAPPPAASVGADEQTKEGIWKWRGDGKVWGGMLLCWSSKDMGSSVRGRRLGVHVNTLCMPFRPPFS